ncbi:thioredoxin [Serinibacter salmoneus]|uniref:Thioredoxin n=1 Tax=Serinibacter salmoneus TaxID=556530 RepID=A0A2A9D3Q0_9MICO|nr:thioredoxin [Serinibacter salmoneus]PFG20966.1 thioredoxin [Serinibacter salmoneus]
MATIELTAQNFGETIQQNGTVVVDFWAEWCGPCKQFAPTFEKAAQENPDITFGKVDTDAEQQLAGQAQITSIPTLMVFRDQILVHRSSGALPPAQFNQLLTAVNDLDMDQVRKEIAEQEAAKAADGAEV